MRKYFLELFAIGLVDSEGRINSEHMTSDALMTSMKTMEELTQMKMDRLVLETTMEMILCMFESCDTEEFTEIFGKLLGGKQASKVTAHLEALEELLTEEEYRGRVNNLSDIRRKLENRRYCIPVIIPAFHRIRVFCGPFFSNTIQSQSSLFFSSFRTDSQYFELSLSPTVIERTSFFPSVLMPRMT